MCTLSFISKLWQNLRTGSPFLSTKYFPINFYQFISFFFALTPPLSKCWHQLLAQPSTKINNHKILEHYTALRKHTKRSNILLLKKQKQHWTTQDESFFKRTTKTATSKQKETCCCKPYCRGENHLDLQPYEFVQICL